MSAPILDLDLGNTRLKYRYRVEGESAREGAIAHQDGLSRTEFRGFTPGRVRIASVAGPEILEPLVAFCRERWQVEPELARVCESCAGVRQGYDDMRRLGVDRWLAVLAAYHGTDTASVVVSCGTAVTVDLVTAGGAHLGGYIVPGFDLMRGALFARTSAVKLERLERPETLLPGNNTVDAVNRGLVLMVKSLVQSASAELNGDMPVAVVITGGDGELLLPFLAGPGASTNVQYRPNLVLDGLPLALP
ncbi:type III pantothenate kinase [Proteobacteria bacterium 005FR1]|nr:type III pantothenate kinase [Proteobacteria bacterium 005FR1]